MTTLTHTMALRASASALGSHQPSYQSLVRRHAPGKFNLGDGDDGLWGLLIVVTRAGYRCGNEAGRRGKLFITPSYLCYHPKFNKDEDNCVLPLKSIVCVERVRQTPFAHFVAQVLGVPLPTRMAPQVKGHAYTVGSGHAIELTLNDNSVRTIQPWLHCKPLTLLLLWITNRKSGSAASTTSSGPCRTSPPRPKGAATSSSWLVPSHE